MSKADFEVLLSVLVSLQLTVFSAAELLGGACPMYSWSSQAYKLFCLSRIVITF
jgi:hypothetical protein